MDRIQVAAWLEALGLACYAPAFAEHAVEPAVLGRLTDDDLKEIGVSAVGHRRKLLEAAARLLPGTGSATAAASRRQLTVMFVDLVGYTALSSSLDPEELREVVSGYRAGISAQVRRFGGTVAMFQGDGVLAYFGYPEAHEDDAERAVHAGLAIIGSSASLLRAPPPPPPPSGTSLRVRVGVATGLVVVGSGETHEWAAVGETPTLAARLQEIAPPNAVLVADGTRSLAGGVFDYAPLGDLPVKGFARPVRAWRVLGRSPVEGRFEARRQAMGSTPLVGRELELARAHDLWREAAGGGGRAALVHGEAGIGKSRLVQEVRDRLQPKPFVRLHCRCSPIHASSPLQPVVEALAANAGFAHGDDVAAKLDKLEVLLAQATDDVASVAPVIAELLSLPIEGRYAAEELAPQTRRERTLAALLGQLEGLARRGPVLLVFEDAHWSDPTSLELIRLAVDRIRTLPVLIVVTSRPEFVPDWADRPRVATMALDRLDAAASRAMVRGLAGRLPEEAVAQLVERADGVPLFIEELTRAVLDTRMAGAPVAAAGEGLLPTAAAAVPATLHDSLVARLDRLPEAREVAQLAACLGREFDHRVLAAISPWSSRELERALDLLVGSGLLFRSGSGPTARYRFKHALVCDVAYATLLRRRRRELHGRIAAALATSFPELAAARPELLAEHSTQAGEFRAAIRHWRQAGLNAARRSAVRESMSLLRRGLAPVPELPDTPERARLELELQVALGASLMAAHGEAAPEIGAAYRRARQLCRGLRDEAVEPAVLWGVWHNHMNRAELPQARAVAGEQIRRGRLGGCVVGQALGHRCAMVVDLFAGSLAGAVRHRERVRALRPPPPPAETCGEQILIDPWVTGASLGAWATVLGNRPDEGAAEGAAALAAARRCGRPYMLAVVLHHQNLLAQFLDDVDTVADRSAELLKLAGEHGFAHWHATATLMQGWVAGCRGGCGEAVETMERGLAAKRATGSRLKLAYYRALTSDFLAVLGRAREGLALVDEGLEQVALTGEAWFTAELRRRRGGLLLALGGDPAEAEHEFRRALAVARSQRAWLWELRVGVALAQLWAEGGERRRAHDLLAPIRGRFAGGSAVPGLAQGAALVDALA